MGFIFRGLYLGLLRVGLRGFMQGLFMGFIQGLCRVNRLDWVCGTLQVTGAHR